MELALATRSVPPEIHQHLPWWSGYASVLFTCALWFVATLLLCALGAGIAGWSLKDSPGEPWHERARHAHALRMLSVVQVIIWPPAALMISSLWPFPFGFSSLAARGFPPALASLAAAIIVRLAAEKRILFGRHSTRRLLQSALVYHLTLGHVLLLLAAFAVLIMPWQWNLATGVIVVATVAGFLFFGLGGSLLVLRSVGLLKPADERVQRIVGEAAQRVGATPPPSCIARMPSANALAFPWSGRLVFSEGILECLDDEQLRAIAAHEICHLAMPTSQKIMRLLQPLAVLVPLLLIKPVWGTFGSEALLPALIGISVLILTVRWLGRRLMLREEERADRAGAADNEAAYAEALERTYRENMIPANWKSPQGHPSLYDRMTAAGVQPAYSRPERPPLLIRYAALAVETMAFLAMTTALVVAYAVASALIPQTIFAKQAFLAVAGGTMRHVAELGELHIAGGNQQLGIALLEFARAKATDDVEVLALLAKGYADLGRCEEAVAVLQTARTSFEMGPAYRSDEEALAAAEDAVAGCR